MHAFFIRIQRSIALLFKPRQQQRVMEAIERIYVLCGQLELPTTKAAIKQHYLKGGNLDNLEHGLAATIEHDFEPLTFEEMAQIDLKKLDLKKLIDHAVFLAGKQRFEEESNAAVEKARSSKKTG